MGLAHVASLLTALSLHWLLLLYRSVAEAHVNSSIGLEDLDIGSSGSVSGNVKRVKVEDFDFFGDRPFPLGHDVITMGMVLHDWGLPKKLLLMQR